MVFGVQTEKDPSYPYIQGTPIITNMLKDSPSSVIFYNKQMERTQRSVVLCVIMY